MRGLTFFLCLALPLLAACANDGGDPNKRVATKPAPVLTSPSKSAETVAKPNWKETQAPSLTALPEEDRPYVGHWSVSDVLPVENGHSMPLRLGATLWLLDKQASDLDGRLCNGPVYQREQGDLAKIGNGMQISGNGPISVTLVEVTCGQSAFGSYILHPDGMMILRRPEALYVLERMGGPAGEITEAINLPDAEPAKPSPAVKEVTASAPTPAAKPAAAPASVPVPSAAPLPPAAAGTDKAKPSVNKTVGGDEPPPPIASPAPKVKSVPMPANTPASDLPPLKEARAPVVQDKTIRSAPPPSVTEAAQIPAAPAPTKEAAQHLAHLASYKGKTAAEKGWQILLARYPDMKKFQKQIVELQVAGQGDIYRLFAAGADKAGLADLCAAMNARKDYCVLMN